MLQEIINYSSPVITLRYIGINQNLMEKARKTLGNKSSSIGLFIFDFFLQSPSKCCLFII